MNDRFKPILILLALGVGSMYLIKMALGSVETGVGIIAGLVAASICFFIVAREKQDQRFLLRLFFGALALRWLLSSGIDYFGLRPVVSPDAYTYDAFGYAVLQNWMEVKGAGWTPKANVSGWGMPYYVAAIYYFVGQSNLAVQYINCTLGAMTCVLVYKISLFIYPEVRVARLAGILTAVTPSIILWSSQAIKEGPIMFCLALSSYLGLKICRRFDLLSFVGLILTLIGLYGLRNYAFFIFFIGIAGALVFTSLKFSAVKGIQGFLLTVVLSIMFVYFGAGQTAMGQLDIQKAQNSRQWSARVSGSGYGGDVDITDTKAAITFLPIGILYVLFAPFPWMVKSMVQATAVPETIVWWLTFPLLIRGYWFILRQRLLEALPLCIFTLGLTFVYALYQTNAGTVYRQRTQLLIFFVIFVSIGWDRWQIARRKKSVNGGRWSGIGGVLETRNPNLETTFYRPPTTNR